MQRNQLQKLIARVMRDGYQSNAYRDYIDIVFRELFTRENLQDILALSQAELKNPDLKHQALVWDIYLRAREGIKPYDPSNIIPIKTGMLYQSPYAYNIRAVYFREGIKSAIDYARAYELFLQAKELGNVNANYHLGVFNLYGLGREFDTTQARYYFELAAQQQFPAAYYVLGLLAKRGRGGFAQNNAQAIEFFKTSAELGDKDALNEICRLAHEMYPRTRQGYHESEIPLITFAAEFDHPAALTQLGYIYFTKKKYLTAKWLFERASKFNVSQAFHNLGIMYRDSLGVQKSLSRAMYYFKRGAKAGHVVDYALFTKLYLKKGSNHKDNKVIKYLEKGAALNQTYCINRLAYFYYYSLKGLQQDIAKAVELWLKGHNLGDATCRYNLAFLRLKEEIDAITEEKAWSLLEMAIAAQDPLACFFRAELYAKANQLELSAKFYRKGFFYHGKPQYENFRESFSVAQSGSTIQRYHWYMTDVNETLSTDILKLYNHNPWIIIQAILSDDIITDKSKIAYLTLLPGAFLQHIKSLSYSHPLRVNLENLYQSCELDLIYAYCRAEIEATELLEQLNELAAVVNDARLPAYLTITILFDAILKGQIDELEIPRALARIYVCHKTIMCLDHFAAAQNILVDHAGKSYMSLDAYLYLLSEHIELIEAYVSILREEIAKISSSLSVKQSFALVNAPGLLKLTDELLDASKEDKQHTQLSEFSNRIKAINTAELWHSLKNNTQNSNQQIQLAKALQFFNAGKVKSSANNQSSPPTLRNVFKLPYGSKTP